MLTLSDVLTAIRSSQTQIISFDIFDTLLTRPFWEPSDLFALMEDDVQSTLQTFDLPNYCDLRIEAEKMARECTNNQDCVIRIKQSTNPKYNGYGNFL